MAGTHIIGRDNVDATLLSSAARTATVASADQANETRRGVNVLIKVTAIVSSPSVVFTVQGKDATTGDYYDLLSSAAITGTGTTVLRVYPGNVAVANLAISYPLPRVWRVNCVHGNGDSITYSVGACVLL